MERYQVLSSAPVHDVEVRSSLPDYPRIHESFADKQEAGNCAKLLRTTYKAWQMSVKVIVLDTATGQIVEN